MARSGTSGQGRPKGVPNKVTAAQKLAVAKSGLSPLDYMLSLLCDANRPDAERFEAAKAAAPYVHARLASVDANMTGDMSFTIVVNKP